MPLPGLEVARPDWPADTHLIGPLLWEPTDDLFDRPAGDEPLVVLAPSTAETGAADMVGVVLEALSEPVLGRRVRVVVSGLHRPTAEDLARFGGGVPAPITAGLGRQDEVLAHARVLICGSGHGILAKAMTAGVPVVAVPGGGDQWELANRLQRAGAGRWVRPLTVDAVADAVRAVLDDPGHARCAERIGESGTDTVDPVVVAERRVGLCA